MPRPLSASQRAVLEWLCEHLSIAEYAPPPYMRRSLVALRKRGLAKRVRRNLNECEWYWEPTRKGLAASNRSELQRAIDRRFGQGR